MLINNYMVILITTKSGRPAIGFKIDGKELAYQSIEYSSLNRNDNFLKLSIQDITSYFPSYLKFINIKIDYGKIFLSIFELDRNNVFLITNSQNSERNYLDKILTTEKESIRDALWQADHDNVTVQSILTDMQGALTRYMSFIAAFKIESNILIGSTIGSKRRKEMVLADNVYKELVRKSVINHENTQELEIGNKILGELQIFYFVVKGIAYVIYSAVEINTGIIRLKLTAWLKQNSNRFKLIPENSQKINIQSYDSLHDFELLKISPSVEILIRYNS